MNLRGLNMKSIIKSNLVQSLYSPSSRCVYPNKPNLPHSPNQNKDKDIKQRKNNNIFRKQLFSQNMKSPKKSTDKNQINIKLNFNSEIINNNFNNQGDSSGHQSNKNNNIHNSNSNSNINNFNHCKNKQKTNQGNYINNNNTNNNNNNTLSYDDSIKEKDKIISILRKELETNQAILLKMHKEREDAPLSFCESEEIDNNRKALTTKGSMNLTSSNKFNQLSSSNINNNNNNGLSGSNSNKAVVSPRCFSSSLNFDSDSTGTTMSQQANNLLANSLSYGIFKTLRKSENNTATNSTKNIGIMAPHLNKQNKAKGNEGNKLENKLGIASSSGLIANSSNEALQAQCKALKQRAKKLLDSYYSVLTKKS